MNENQTFSEIAIIKFSYQYLRQLHERDKYYQELGLKFYGRRF